MDIDFGPPSLPLSQVQEVRTAPAEDRGEYMVGHAGDVDGEPRFLVIERLPRFSAARSVLDHIAEAPGPDLGAFIARKSEETR